MDLLEKVKDRIRADGTAMDSDIQDTIDACILDLELNGIQKSKISDADALIIRAIKTYCIAEYSSDDKEAGRFKSAYEALRDHLALSIEYTGGGLIG